MKKNWIVPALMALAMGLTTLTMTGCKKHEHDHSDGHTHQYICPMKEHADVVQDKPGKCPKCGMALVEKTVKK